MARLPAAATATATVACALALVGCGASTREPASPEPDAYPLITQEDTQRQPPVTTPSGAVVQYPVVPTERELEPSPTCERTLATFHDGSKPTRRPVIVPPAPGLRAQRITPRRVRIEWSFKSLPADCRPASVLLSITATGGTPTNVQADVHSTSGSSVIEYPNFLPLPETAIASAYTRDGKRSHTVKVAIAP